MSNNKLTPAQLNRVFNTSNMNGKSWADIMDEKNAEYAAMTPAAKAAHNAQKKRLAAYNLPPIITRRNNAPAAAATRRQNNGRGAAARYNNRGPASRRNNRAFGSRRNNRTAAAAWKPRAGKVMRECRDSRTGCARHQATGDCKFIHPDEPEYAHLRANQRL